MTSNGTPNLRIVSRNNVVEFVPRGPSYHWHCIESGCPAKGQSRYEATAVASIARHWSDVHDPDGNRAA